MPALLYPADILGLRCCCALRFYLSHHIIPEGKRNQRERWCACIPHTRTHTRIHTARSQIRHENPPALVSFIPLHSQSEEKKDRAAEVSQKHLTTTTTLDIVKQYVLATDDAWRERKEKSKSRPNWGIHIEIYSRIGRQKG